MLTEQEVIEALRDSNPVPEPERLHRVALEADTLFSSITERREAMLRTTLKSRQPVAPDQHERRRRWYRKPAVVAAALLILFGTTAATALYLNSYWPPLDREFPGGPTSGIWTSFGAEDGIGEGCARRLALSPNGTVWLAGDCGLLRYDGDTWQHETDIPDFGDAVVDLTVAPVGSVWIGSSTAPLQEYDGEAMVTHPVKASRVVVTPDGIVWGEGGEPYSADSQLLRYDDAEWTNLSEPGSQASIALGGDGTLWVVTYPFEGTGLEAPLLQSYRDGSWTTHEIPDALFRDETGHWSISAPAASGPDGVIWMFGSPAEQPGTRPELWEVPLVRFDGETWTEATYAIPAGEIEQVEIAPDGTVWVNSWYGVFALVGEEWTLYTTEHGMPSGMLNFIEIGVDGAIWFGSDTGVARYMPEQ